MQNVGSLRWLQIGLGSMGKRRIRNLLFLGIAKEQITGFDMSAKSREEAEKKYGIVTFADFEEAKRHAKADAFIISTPPNQHHRYFLDAARQKKHFFVEVTTTDAGYDELYPLLDGSFVSAPSCTFRYFPAIKKIKELLATRRIGKPLFFTHHVGQYLPDWHPWEDYRKVYFAQKETGACREMFGYELIWLTDLLGATVSKASGFTGKVSDLEMTADDLYASVVALKNGVIGTLVVDLLARTEFRTLRIVGALGVIEWEWANYQIRVFDVSQKQWETINIPKGDSEENYVTTEEMYREEMKHFLDAITGDASYPYTFTEDHQILGALHQLENPPART